MKLLDESAPDHADLTGQIYEPWLFLTMLDQLSSSDVSIGFIYSVLELLAKRYLLSDAVVVLRDESLGTQVFRLGRKNVSGDSPARLATSPGVFSEPDIVPDVVREAVRNVCQVALTLHLTRYGTDHDPLTSIANKRYLDSTLRFAAVQSSRYGWAFTLVLLDLNGFKALNDRVGHVVGNDLLRTFSNALRQSVRSGDTAARIADHQFAIILWNAPGTEYLAFTERLRTLLGSTPGLEFTVGTAFAPQDTTDPAELYRIADARLQEKNGGVLQ